MPSIELIKNILKDSNYDLTIFEPHEIEALANRITLQTTREKLVPYVDCVVRGKPIVLKPEEVVRQLFAAQLIDRYRYSKKRIAFEHPIHFGRQVKRADIVIFDKDRPNVEYIIVEIKMPK
ncbi:MAG TPA: type I restriction enzyme HsdR N-terminal domain-containing protein, partial [Anaerolineales bacterium]|nr:type I restriction enzyme HsdR N-terminal domain-containing protein [Anaerolineales bacterium]